MEGINGEKKHQPLSSFYGAGALKNYFGGVALLNIIVLFGISHQFHPTA